MTAHTSETKAAGRQGVSMGEMARTRFTPMAAPARDFQFAVNADSSRSVRDDPKGRSSKRRPHHFDPYA
jgi:hypothetical protein